MVSAAQQVAPELLGGHAGKPLVLPLLYPRPKLPPASRAVPSLLEGGSMIWGGSVEEDLGFIA